MFKDPQVLHIAIEVVMILALAFWVSSSNRQTANRFKALLDKIDIQDAKIAELEGELNKIKAYLNRAAATSNNASKQPEVNRVAAQANARPPSAQAPVPVPVPVTVSVAVAAPVKVKPVSPHSEIKIEEMDPDEAQVIEEQQDESIIQNVDEPLPEGAEDVVQDPSAEISDAE